MVLYTDGVQKIYNKTKYRIAKYNNINEYIAEL
jgi:hypothetical protein